MGSPAQDEGYDQRALAAAAVDRHVLVGVTGGIAAYKACTVVSRLVQAGARVTVAMTPGATRFVTPLTFAALSGRTVYSDAWNHVEAGDPQHVNLGAGVDLAVVCPCSMDCLARLASGRCDDIVTLILATIDQSRTPVMLAPSMNARMWAQPSTVRNVATLTGDGFEFIGPDAGWQACRTLGMGRMREPEAILARITQRLASIPRAAN